MTDPFAALQQRIESCASCRRLRRHCREVADTRVARFRHETYWGRPVPGFGDPAARLLVVGLAPGAHGANRTGRMFTGDSSGDWLYEALHRYGFANQAHSRSRDDGLKLNDCWISAAGRCAPPANRPTAQELARCRPFLEEELRLLTGLRVVVTLGRIATEAYLRASGRWSAPERQPFGPGVTTRFADGIVLVTSYHPSRQNTNTGRLTRQMWHGVFAEAARLVDAPFA